MILSTGSPLAQSGKFMRTKLREFVEWNFADVQDFLSNFTLQCQFFVLN